MKNAIFKEIFMMTMHTVYAARFYFGGLFMRKNLYIHSGITNNQGHYNSGTIFIIIFSLFESFFFIG